VRDSRIFEAHSDLQWVNNGAAVRVSNVAFGNVSETMLNGEAVDEIYANLTGGFYARVDAMGVDDPLVRVGSNDITQAKPLALNKNTVFEGTKKYGAFDIDGATARQWLMQPCVGNRNHSDVVKPWRNGIDLSKRHTDTWIVDFGTHCSESDAALYEAPFEYVLANVKPERQLVRRERTQRLWWLHEEARVAMRAALLPLPRYIATPRVAKHRFFVWLDKTILPDTRLNAVARADDCTLGMLSSRIHEVWSLANASIHGDGDEGGRPTYNAKSCFETFPFPAGLSPADTASQAVQVLASGVVLPVLAAESPHALAIATAAHTLNTLREQWLNPAAWTDRVPEIVPLGMAQSPYPDRIVTKADLSADDAKSLNQRTLTNLYNQRPAWLVQAHAALDAAVAAAYGWTDDASQMSDALILQRLLALNLAQSE
jgi:hypothetical protein